MLIQGYHVIFDTTLWNLVCVGEGGLPFEKDRVPGLIDVLQFGQDLCHLSEDQQRHTCGWAVGPVCGGVLGTCYYSHFSQHRFLQSEKLSSQRVPEELFLLMFGIWFFSSSFSHVEMGRSSFNISSSVHLAAWGTGMHFKVPFLSACYPVKTLKWPLKHWMRLWVLQSHTSVGSFKYKVKLFQWDGFRQ